MGAVIFHRINPNILREVEELPARTRWRIQAIFVSDVLEVVNVCSFFATLVIHFRYVKEGDSFIAGDSLAKIEVSVRK